MAKSRKKLVIKETYEPYTIEEWNEMISDVLKRPYLPNAFALEAKWLETSNGTLWPHKVVRG